MRAGLPASGAWRPGDPPAFRRFITLATDRPFVLEGGGFLRDITVAYEAWGELAPDAGNAVLVCHALTGDAHAAGPLAPGQPTPGWWDALIGPGRAIDTDRYFVVCANVVGGCQGSTGPASPNPANEGRPYGADFPVVSVRDMVRTQAALGNALGIRTWLSVVGGSMGGMQVLEWGAMFPERARSLVPLSVSPAATAQQIAWWSSGRRAIRLDPRWAGGHYYDAPPGEGPTEGLRLARMISQITFRSDDVFTERFGREVVEPLDGFDLWQRFQVERYLEYHGTKLARRFDANSYLLLTKAMDLNDLSRGRGGVVDALARLVAPTLVMGVSSDILYPAYQQRSLCEALCAQGTPATYVEIDSPHGHDAFLLEAEQVGAALADFLADMEKA